MRLLNTASLELESIPGNPPPYAILSHTWEEGEVTLQDLLPGGSASQMTGYAKLFSAATLAKSEGYSHLWMDTCCIDKTSSAELSEAINSMFRWYRNADVCYAFLHDVDALGDSMSMYSPFQQSKWFTRGWTLQELIAPRELFFVNRHWVVLDTRRSLRYAIERRTKVPVRVLSGGSLDDVAIACKMSWAAERVTTRPEDVAYCLLGIFDVNMPLLYGEGAEKAFIRLQEELFKMPNEDESLFAWKMPSYTAKAKPYWGLLATSPRYFKHASRIRKPEFMTRLDRFPPRPMNGGLEVRLPLVPLQYDNSHSIFVALLDCPDETAPLDDSSAIILQRLSNLEHDYARIRPDVLLGVFQDQVRITSGLLTEQFQTEFSVKAIMEQFGDLYIPSHMEQNFGGSVFHVRSMPKPAAPIAGMFVKETTRFFESSEAGSTVTAELQQEGKESLAPKWRFGNTYPGEMRWILDFHKNSHQMAQRFTVASLRKRRVAGYLPVRFDVAAGGNSREQISRILIVGFEPLPENPFATPAAYVRPWYSFTRRVSETDVARHASHDVGDDELLEQALELPGGRTLMVDWGTGVVNSRLYYEAKFALLGGGD